MYSKKLFVLRYEKPIIQKLRSAVNWKNLQYIFIILVQEQFYEFPWIAYFFRVTIVKKVKPMDLAFNFNKVVRVIFINKKCSQGIIKDMEQLTMIR